MAQRLTVALAAGGVLDVYDAHLVTGDEAERHRQAVRLLAAMDGRGDVPHVLVGDLNASPARPSIQLLTSRLRSAYAAVHGAEPARTVPTPLRRRAAAGGVVMDYVLVGPRVVVHDARLIFDEVEGGDLAASDHYGLAATISVASVLATAG